MKTSSGTSYPIGANVMDGGLNFVLWSKHSTAVELLLFDSTSAKKPSKVISLDAETNRTFYYWHIFVEGLKPGQVYGTASMAPLMPRKAIILMAPRC